MRALRIRSIVAVAVLVSLWAGAGWAQTLRVVGFTVESGDARPDVVDDLIAAAQGVDLWGFSEVQDAIWATMFAQAAADGETGTFAPILGSTGGGDRLLIVYHQERFGLIRSFEFTDINIGGNVRTPLVAHFRLKPAGPEFLFMVNHLYRSNAERRHGQARLLNAWARQQTLPVIAGWHFDEWGERYPGTTRAAWTAELAGRCEWDRIPLTFVALVEAEPVGSASLVVYDMDTRPNLTPWLAAVYVLPTFRRRGIATALVTHALGQARRFGVRQLYLWTDSAVSLYRRLGWRPLVEAPYWGKPVLVMVRDLTAKAGHAADAVKRAADAEP